MIESDSKQRILSINSIDSFDPSRIETVEEAKWAHLLLTKILFQSLERLRYVRLSDSEDDHCFYNAENLETIDY